MFGGVAETRRVDVADCGVGIVEIRAPDVKTVAWGATSRVEVCVVVTGRERRVVDTYIPPKKRVCFALNEVLI